MKKCISCGRQLPDQAAWCPYCETEQTEPKNVRTPVRRIRWILAVIAAAVILCAGLLALRLHHSPKTYEGDAEVSYGLGKTDCRVYLSFRIDAGKTKEAMESIDARVRPGDSAAVISLLFVKSETDESVEKAFLDQVESCSVTATPIDGSKAMDVKEPYYPENLPTDAVYAADVVYYPDTPDNSIIWDIKMKNGDTIRLQHTVECTTIPVVVYHYEDTPMDTIEELNALIEKAAREEPQDAVLELYLPPVTYEGALAMDARTAILFGSEEDGRKTTFTDTVTVQTRDPYVAEFYDLEFQGSGGCGILSREGLRLQACLFAGWDVGVDVQNGGWASVNNAAFVGNGIGLRFDSRSSTYANPTYENVVFAENETGMEIRHVPGDRQLEFFNPVFDNNQTDYYDPDGHVVISGSSDPET